MKKNVTLKEIARELEVSVSTVSKALRDNEEISLDTRQKIQAFAKLFNYRPNSIALNLRNQSTKSIAIIIPEIVNHFFSKVIKGIEKEASQRNYNVIITVSNDSFEKEVLNVQTLANGSIDGFIVSVAKETMRKNDYRHLNETIAQGVPVVMFDRKSDQVACDKVAIDDRSGAQKATQKLLDSGCKQIVLITTEDFVSVGKLRKEGYLKALQKNKLTIDPELIIEVDDTLNSDQTEAHIAQKLKQLLKKHPHIDGLIGVNEFYTITAVNYFKSQNIKIPDQISVIAFSDGVLPKYSFPSITAIFQHGKQMGQSAAKLLLDRLEGVTAEDHYQTIILKSELIERESTKNK